MVLHYFIAANELDTLTVSHTCKVNYEALPDYLLLNYNEPFEYDSKRVYDNIFVP